MLKKLSIVIASIALCSSLLTTTAEAKPTGLARVCKKVVGMGGYIYKNYQPLRRGPHDHTLIGYTRNPTLLDMGGGSNRGNANVYDATGKKLATCQGLSCTDCRNHWRYKCYASTAIMRKAAMNATRTPKIYFNVGNKCVEIADAGRCVGSIKGLCNQLIK